MPRASGSRSEESGPLLQPDRVSAALAVDGEIGSDEQETLLTKRQLWSLYLSHFLSTWNARGYEFAAIIFTASAYPETLTASSVRGILTTIATIVLSSSVGQWCDKHPSRLEALRITIFVQRICVVFACLGWVFIVQGDFPGGDLFTVIWIEEGSMETRKDAILGRKPWGKGAVMAGIMFLGIGERLSAVGNMMVMERDWVPTFATSSSKPSLPELNAMMRRIDLQCKLVAPVFISVIAIWAANMHTTIFIIASMNLISVGIEWFTARNVWMECEKLQAPRPITESRTGGELEDMGLSRTKTRWKKWGRGLRLFFRSEIWIPSLALALLYFSVLSFSASMITYLLNAGFTLSVITIARTGSTFIEVSSTVVMPWSVKVMERATAWNAARAYGQAPSLQPAAAVERAGLWGLWWMVVNLIPVTLILFYLPATPQNTAHPNPILTISLFVFLAFSRLGLWTYDLVAQTLVQTRIPAGRRGEFSGVEMSFISAAELAQWVATAIWSSPGQFKFLAAAGNTCILVSTLAYTAWMWKRRGHLLHWEKVMVCTDCK